MVAVAPAASAATFQAHTYNMAMGNETISTGPNGGVLHDQVQADVILIAQQQLPWTVSVQEICQDQWRNILFALDDYGLVGPFVATREGDLRPWTKCQIMPGESVRRRGNAVYSIGSPLINPPFGGYSSASLTPIEPGGNPEPRIAVCRRTAVLGFNMDACSVHLSDTTFTAFGQVWTLFNWSQGYANVWNVTGGDFNQNWCCASGLPVLGLAAHFLRGSEMQMDTNNLPTHDNGNKFDYIFAFRTHSPNRVGEINRVFTISDHHYSIATFVYQ
jgi:hypothetical protein